jgi:hypothetical protein
MAQALYLVLSPETMGREINLGQLGSSVLYKEVYLKRAGQRPFSR